MVLQPGCFLSILTLGIATSCLTPLHARADWPNDPGVNVPLCTAAGTQFSPTMISDGAGGAIVTWRQDSRSGFDDIYVQRVDAQGVPQWTTDGVAVCVLPNEQSDPTIVSDGAGGAIIAWQDYRNGINASFADIYAQRVNAAGTPQWTPNGVAVCTAATYQDDPAIVSDGAGGAIVAWTDGRGSSNYSDIYAQRVNGAGVLQWTVSGVVLCAAAITQRGSVIVSDGAGGAIVAWHDWRVPGEFDIYAQRVSASGTTQWTVNGTAICTAPDYQSDPSIVSDGAGGAIIGWHDDRSGQYDIYVQHVNAGGAPQWTADGMPLCTEAGDQSPVALVPDGAGGAIVAWGDQRSGSSDIYAQRVNAAGVPQWTANGLALCLGTVHAGPTIVSDDEGGAIVTWSDTRNGMEKDIYAQRINTTGAPLWPVDGVALCTAANDQMVPSITSDGANGAIVAWADYRNGGWDIYAQGVERSGHIGTTGVAPGGLHRSPALAAPRPNPARQRTALEFALPTSGMVRLTVHDVQGRQVHTVASSRFEAGTHALTFDLLDGRGRRLSSGLYLVRLEAGGVVRTRRLMVVQ